jgi:hypothetical protein
MELFSEVYSCYFTVVARILEQAENGLSKTEIEKLIRENGFYESTFHLLPSLFSGEWNFFEERDGRYHPKPKSVKIPLTVLEKSWLKALLGDPKIKLFLDDGKFAELENMLSDTEPLFNCEDFHVYDRHLDGDNYTDPCYISRFRTVITALKEHNPLVIEYETSKGGRIKRLYHPYKLLWSARDDKFRLLCAEFNPRGMQLKKSVLNLAGIISAKVSDSEISPNLISFFQAADNAETITVEISNERNALERCMLQFASFERHTEFDRERSIYVCRIKYDISDQTELLIRILSFGPVIKVTEPESFLTQIRKRLERQIMLNLRGD